MTEFVAIARDSIKKIPDGSVGVMYCSDPSDPKSAINNQMVVGILGQKHAAQIRSGRVRTVFDFRLAMRESVNEIALQPKPQVAAERIIKGQV